MASDPDPEESILGGIESLEATEGMSCAESQGVESQGGENPIADKMARCEERLGYVFRDKGLLRAALTHASGAEHRLASNERLEFLGDAVLGLVVCDVLYRNHPSFLEGELTRVKSSVVSRQTCAKLSTALGLDEFLILGKGMASTGAVPQSLMADVFESLIAAMYLDGGDEVARDFLARHLAEEIAAAVALAHSDNAKSLLQQIAQKRFGATPSYQLLDEKGPDHSKCFKMGARAGTREFAPAWGRNKKEAEQRAACNALAEINGESLPFEAE
ncbi:MAG: ribonuclease III [Pirellulales bacterium]